MANEPNEDEIVQSLIYDSRAYEMAGFAPMVRPIVAHYGLQVAFKRLSEHVSDLRGQPLLTRQRPRRTEYQLSGGALS
jgi:fructoselysine 6-phosphate deglycase